MCVVNFARAQCIWCDGEGKEETEGEFGQTSTNRQTDRQMEI